MGRRFSFALLAVVCISSLLAPAQNSQIPKAAVAKPVRRTKTPLSAGPAPTIQPPAQTTPAPKPCNSLDEYTKLGAARYEFEDLHLESAAAKYQSLVTSCVDAVRLSAIDGFNFAHDRMSTWWWVEGRYFPPLRWCHHPRFWEASIKTLLIIVVFFLITWPLFYLTDLHLFHWATVPFIGVQRRMRNFFLVDHLPRACIMDPFGLTGETQARLFASMLENSSQDVRRVLDRAGGGLQVRATALLAIPSETTNALIEALPKVKGVDVAGIAKFFLYLKRYMGWRVESEIGYCPATKASDGTESPARVVASASLRHAFWVRGGPWPVERLVQHAYDVDGVAFAIAARIMGFNMRGNRAR